MTDPTNPPAPTPEHPFRDDDLEALRSTAWHMTPMLSTEAADFRARGGSVSGEERGERPTDPIVAGIDDAVERFAELVSGFRRDGSHACLLVSEPEELPDAFGRRAHQRARDVAIELVRTALVAALDDAGGARTVAASAEPPRRASFLSRLRAFLVDGLLDLGGGYDVRLVERPLQPGELERMRAATRHG